MKSNASVWGGALGNYKIIGSVGKSEYVTVVAKEGDMVCIEYNTDSGKRKRGYLSQGYLDFHRPNLTYSDFWYSKSVAIVPYNANIYAGPSYEYAIIGTMSSNAKHLSCCMFDRFGSIGWYPMRVENADGTELTGWID